MHGICLEKMFIKFVKVAPDKQTLLFLMIGIPKISGSFVVHNFEIGWIYIPRHKSQMFRRVFHAKFLRRLVYGELAISISFSDASSDDSRLDESSVPIRSSAS